MARHIAALVIISVWTLVLLACLLGAIIAAFNLSVAWGVGALLFTILGLGASWLMSTDYEV